MNNQALLPRTQALLDKHPATLSALREIADGAGVGFEWLRKFKARCDHDYGVQKVQALHDYLVRKKRVRA